MIEPVLRDEAFLADVRTARGPSPRLWWLGQSGFLIHWAGHFLLIDPYLSDSLTRKYAATDKPHTRMTELVVDPAALDMVEIVTSSHNHTDHLDAETLLPLMAANPNLTILVPEANRDFAAQRLGCAPDRFETLRDGQSKQIGPFQFHGVASAHEQLDTTPDGLSPYLGYVVHAGDFCIYHPGDTVLYEGMIGKLRQHSIDLAMLPINGTLPERRVAGNLWGREAAQLAHHAGIRKVIPCHYEMFEFNTASPDEFIEHCRAIGQEYVVLRNGEGVTL